MNYDEQCSLFEFQDIFGSGANQIPAGQVIQSATLRLYNWALDGDPSLYVTLSPMLAHIPDYGTGMRQVQQGAVCWYQKAYGIEDWAGGTHYGPIPGSDYDDSVQVTRQCVATGNWMEFDITGIAQGWSDGTLANNGVCIYPASKPSSGPQLAIGFRTSDAWVGDPGTANAPELVVEYVSNPVPLQISGARQLFVDDYLVGSKSNLERQVHQPIRHPQNPLIRYTEPWES